MKVGFEGKPFNIRYCARTYGMDRKGLERNLPALAQINRDGNCFIIMLIVFMVIFLTGTRISPISTIGMATLVLFLSLGSPNQPGSILIGVMIVTMYLQCYNLVCLAIYAEALFGGLQNIVNVIGDIVEAAIEDGFKKDSQITQSD